MEPLNRLDIDKCRTDITINPFPRRDEKTTLPTSRMDLARLMQQICVETHAERYMLVQPTVECGPKPVKFITSNWTCNMLEDFGTVGISKILKSDISSPVGMMPAPFLAMSTSILNEEEKAALLEHGHFELYCQTINIHGSTTFALWSSGRLNRVNINALMRASMKWCYGLSKYFASQSSKALDNLLSERERECLQWVSQGKTTEEIALILGVSPNTINSYITHAIQKFGAKNRAMVISMAIRRKII